MDNVWDISGTHLLVTGKDCTRFLHGLCTADLNALSTGQHAVASFLNAKGRVRGVADVLVQEEGLLLLLEPCLVEKTQSFLNKHAILDDVTIEKKEVEAHHVWVTSVDVWNPPLLGKRQSTNSHERIRVEGGRPKYGIDVSEDNFPFESTLGQFVDYKKGCYIGQEPVSRVHFKGQPSKQLRKLTFEGDAPPAPEKISHEARSNAGTMTSSFGNVAMGYIHRSVDNDGDTVTVAGQTAVISNF